MQNLYSRRPITLLNVDYKIFTKIINDIIKPLLPDIILPSQNGFVQNRWIIDNIITFNEVASMAKQSPRYKRSCATLIDFVKAFDSISHSALLNVLHHFGFPGRFVSLIKELLSNSTAKVRVNNFLTEPISIRRGTKQGDPLSPSLFTILMELLNIAINFDENIAGFEFGQANSIKILLFADDVVLFSQKEKDLELMLKWLKFFKEATNLVPNRSKCYSIPFNPKDHSCTMYNRVTEKVPATYLGYVVSPAGVHNTTDE